ncbi:MAG: HAMP domain-containing histidine kinase [Candidatus Aminicenantes bacterium]|nr:HAMP domain-containing histidine kinase [Candidatus Aminicenantes bacterium]
MNGDNINSTIKDADWPPLEAYFEKKDWTLKKICDLGFTGLVFLNNKKRKIFFNNKYFSSIVKGKEEEILDKIYSYIDNITDKQKLIHQTHEIVFDENGEEMILGFSPYYLTDDIIAVFFRDITSRTILLENKQENLVYDKLSELVAEMAHEIGNPLSGINTSLHVMLHNLSTWPLEKIQGYIERTIDEINRLANFLKRIREVSKESKLTLKQTNLKRLIDKVLFQNEELLKQKSIIYKNMVVEDIDVIVDSEAFHQIILNLINNSLQILSPGQEIKIYVDDTDKLFIKLVFRNNGVSIPEELMEKIFFPLYTTKDRGGGIGLAISLKLMTRMGGTMKAVPPEDGIGAKFLLYTPY